MNVSRIPALSGIHHVKYAVSDLQTALEFYEQTLGAQRLPQFDHRRSDSGDLYAFICEVPGLNPKLELRLNPKQATAHRGFDQMTIAVENKETLDDWVVHLDDRHIPHSGVFAGIRSWLIAFDDPDGNRLRLYSLKGHDTEVKPDEANIWVRD